MMKKAVAYFFLLAQLIPGTVFAGDYKVVLGKGIEVCEAYLKNLNSFPKAPPMVCERPLNPELKDFQKPEWKALDVGENFALLKEILRYSYKEKGGDFEAYYNKVLPTLKNNITDRQIKLSVTQLDVDLDGKLENVLRHEIDTCDPANESLFATPGGREFFVLNEEKTKIDVQKTKKIHLGGRLDIFLYKGQISIDGWGGNLGFKDGVIYVYTIEPYATPPSWHTVHRCDYNYAPSKSQRKS